MTPSLDGAAYGRDAASTAGAAGTYTTPGC